MTENGSRFQSQFNVWYEDGKINYGISPTDIEIFETLRPP